MAILTEALILKLAPYENRGLHLSNHWCFHSLLKSADTTFRHEQERFLFPTTLMSIYLQ